MSIYMPDQAPYPSSGFISSTGISRAYCSTLCHPLLSACSTHSLVAGLLSICVTHKSSAEANHLLNNAALGLMSKGFEASSQRMTRFALLLFDVLVL